MTPNELHNAIVNLPCDKSKHRLRHAPLANYLRGHKDARHAAAELALSAIDLDTQCKIAFAEMMLIRWDRTEHDSRLFESCVTDMRDGVRSPELLAAMQRVTRELTSK